MFESESTEPERTGGPQSRSDLSLDRDLFVDNCILALQLYVVGERSEPVMHHIDRCSVCAILIHGRVGTPLKTSILEDLEHRLILKTAEVKHLGRVHPSAEVLRHGLSEELTESRVGFKELDAVVRERVSGKAKKAIDTTSRHRTIKTSTFMTLGPIAPAKPAFSRRKWLKVAGIALFAGAAALAWQWNGAAERGQVSNTTGLTLTSGRAKMLDRFDKIFKGSNAAAIRNVMTGAMPDDLANSFDWIAERRVTALYPDIIGYLADARIAVRQQATFHLTLLPPVDLKPMLGQLRNARAAETDVGAQMTLDYLIKRVANS